jgi:dTDP-4-amino-4,6-dideoxygalactose transaminase
MHGGLNVPPATLCLRLPANAVSVAAGLAPEGIETRRWYLPPLHEHPAFRHLRALGPTEAELPATQALADNLLGLPFHTRLSADDVTQVVRALSVVIERQAGTQASGWRAA